jgi:hypothetical protein
LPVGQVIEAGEVTRPAAYLAEQRPPAGGPEAPTSTQERSWVDPTTGQTVTVMVNAGGPAIYTPADIPNPHITPHTPWAKPLSGPEVRVLLVLKNDYYQRDSSLREGVELWQRLGAQIDIANTPSKELFSRHYDAIVVSQQGRGKGSEVLGWSSLDESLRRWILEQAQSGKSGLLLAYPTGLDAPLTHWLNSLSPVSNAPVVRGFPAGATYAHNGPEQFKIYDTADSFFETDEGLQKAVECFQNQKTRVVKLNYVAGGWGINMGLTPDTPLNSAATDTEYDYWQALLARAVLFVAGHNYPAHIASISPEGDGWKVMISTAPAGSSLFLRGRGNHGRIYFQGTRPLSGQSTLIVPGTPMPPHAAVDAILRDAGGRVLDWFSVAVPPGVAVQIQKVALDKPFYAAGDALSGAMSVISAAPGRYELVVRLVDREGRCLRRSIGNVQLNEGEQQIPFTLDIPSSSDSLLMRVRIQLRHNGEIVADRSADCPVPKSSDAGYYVGMSAGATGNRFFTRFARRWFHDDYGLNLVLRQGKHAYGVPARDNLRQVEYTTTLGLPNTEEKLKDWMDDWEHFFPKHLFSDLGSARPYNPLFYSLGEEHIMGVRSSRLPEVTRRFQAYLKDKYQNVEALNSAWGTAYTDWEQVRMLESSIVDMQTIRFDALELDNRRFMEHLFADKHAFLADWIRRAVPGAQIGIHTGWDLWMGRGYDYWLLSRAMDCMMTYEGPQRQYARSFFKNSYGNWYHYQLGAIGNVRWSPWVPLLSGARGVMWYALTPDRWGALASDMRLSGDFAASAEEFRQAGRIGQLLSRMNYQDDQVAIHYSQDSFQRGVANMTWIHQTFINLLFDRGVPFKFYSYQQVADGLLLKNHPKLLILPHSFSLSDGEAEAIRKYVRNGGTLWADVEPGIYSDRGPKLKHSQLADLFENLKPRTIANGPTIHTGSVGKGRVVLADPGAYNYQRGIGEATSEINLIKWLISKAGIQPIARLQLQKSHQPANGIWTAGYRRGGQRYVLVTKDYHLADQTPSRVTLDFNEPGYCYNIREGTYLGHGQKFDQELPATTGEAYAILPYRVEGLEIQEKQSAQPGRDLVLTVRIKAEGGDIKPDDVHLIQVSAHAPDGVEVIALRRLIALPGGKGEIRLPIAFDDAPGQWTVTLRDAASGVTADHAYTVAPVPDIAAGPSDQYPKPFK